MILSRYIALVVFLILSIVIAREKGLPLSQRIMRHSIAFMEGMVGGLIIDSIGINAGYYYFPRQPLYSLSYFAIVLPCWGVFGMLTNYLWTRVGKEKFMKGLIATLPFLFAFYEGSNIITGSWVYTVPFYWVALGWMPLVMTFVGCHRRKKVVQKIDSLMVQYPQYGVSLKVLRALIIVVMFPLLFVSLLKLVKDFRVLRDEHISTRAYVKELLLMGN